jgi:hypothetical protein
MVDHYQALAERANSFSAISRVRLVRSKILELGRDPALKFKNEEFNDEEKNAIISQARESTWANTTKYLRAARLGDKFLAFYEKVDNMAQRCKFIIPVFHD